jgi:hypothetical protein
MRARVVHAFGSPTHWTMEQGRSGWREPVEGDRWSRAVVRLDGSQPVAVASAFHPKLHSSREWCYVEVAPAHRRRGHATLALEELRRSLPSTSGPLRGKVATGSAGERFALAHGFEPLQRTRLVRVSVADRARPRGDRRSVVVGRFAALEDEIVQAWSDYYVGGHAWDPPGGLPLALCREVFFTGDHCVVLAVDHRTIVGIAMLTAAGVGITTFAGGAVSRADPDAVEIATELLGAASHVVEGPLHVELDDWMWEVDQAIASSRCDVVDEAQVVVERPARGC